MAKIIAIIFTVCITSFFYFPVAFSFLPTVNLKTAMAALGLLVLGFNAAKRHDSLFNKKLLILTTLAALVSFVGLFAVTYNNSPDYTYATYVVSMFVWLSAAYVVIGLIKSVHGYASIILVSNYVITVCTAQCIIALLIDLFRTVKIEVDNWFVTSSAGMDAINRMYGIGAALDTAGIRFSAALIMIAYIVANIDRTQLKRELPWYIGAFIIITVIGNMVARTTSVGTIIGLFYLFYKTGLYKFSLNFSQKKLWLWIGGLLLVFVPLIIYFYQTNDTFYKNIRFGFEGFFSLIEKGRWEVSSNSILKGMIVFPESLKTWLIGDGYMWNPQGIDPYYTGPIYPGYYMGTDIGYLRFIFYFGTIGLLLFMFFIYTVARMCMQKFPMQKTLFILLLLLNYAVWFKVSTDIFLVFALFFLIDKEENTDYNNRILLQE